MAKKATAWEGCCLACDELETDEDTDGRKYCLFCGEYRPIMKKEYQRVLERDRE